MKIFLLLFIGISALVDTFPAFGQDKSSFPPDDLWDLGKPTGTGGVWYKTPVQSGEVSDPFLMYGFDKKSVHLYQDSESTVEMTIETDFMGNGDFKVFKKIKIEPRKYLHYEFPDSYSAHWMRISTDKACNATAMIIYH